MLIFLSLSLQKVIAMEASIKCSIFIHAHIDWLRDHTHVFPVITSGQTWRLFRGEGQRTVNEISKISIF